MAIQYMFLITAIGCSLIACKNDGYEDFNTEQTNAIALTGEWYVKAYDATGQATTTYFDLSTSNTAANTTTEIWIDDDGTIELKAKAQGNSAALTFTATDAENLDPEDSDVKETVSISNGKLFTDGARSIGTRTIVDSITLNIVKSIDTTTVITLAGHRVTGFLEDQP